MSEPIVAGAYRLSPAVQQRIVDELPQIAWHDVHLADAERRHAILAEAEVVFGALSTDELLQADRLCWLHWPWSGVPQPIIEQAKDHPFFLSNSAGIHQVSMAEHALSLMLALARQLPAFWTRQQQHQWDRAPAELMVDLAGSTVMVLGTGQVGQAVGRLCQALGMHVLGCRAHPQPTPFVDWLFDRRHLLDLAPKAQWVVSVCPETPETQGWLDDAFFDALPIGARFINIGRGSVADESALLSALESGKLAGAGLDVLPHEPLPADHRLWTLPNVIITPHVAGTPANRGDAAGMMFLRNLHAYLAGDMLDHLIYTPPDLMPPADEHADET